MKKTDVKKTERSKEFLAEEWLEIVLKGQNKGEGRFCRHGVCSFMGRQPLTFQPVKRKPELEKRFIESRIMESRIMESRTMEKRFRGTWNSWSGQEDLDSERNGYEKRLHNKTELTEEAETTEETEMERQLVQKSQAARWEEVVRHVLLYLPEVLVYLGSFWLFWGNEVLTEVGGVLEFYGKEYAVRRQWEREEKEEKKENLEGKQRNSKNRTALDTQKEETMDWNTAFAVLRKFYEEKWDYLNGCPRNEKAWDEEGELQCKIYISKKKGLDRDQKMEVMKLYETVEDRKVSEAVRVICG
ncbi:hypothetical protein [Fusicatenibacter saccharivorans]|uniref:Uncharacterized protein n=1 Tax=Fusicatenibacter saccharivorans TaxID=1150298 RepID=A0A174QT43_9FIRM|nr:hypothetical protein [Fusicatenibacter saccharivorans]CUP76433.1 Uncharacterised protein [Fusicatenibacter saccharivorans]